METLLTESMICYATLLRTAGNFRQDGTQLELIEYHGRSGWNLLLIEHAAHLVPQRIQREGLLQHGSLLTNAPAGQGRMIRVTGHEQDFDLRTHLSQALRQFI